MEKINKQIEWYEQNSARKDDDLIKWNLKLINGLVKEVENSEDRIFINKIIDTFCEIIEIQRDVISDLESEICSPSGCVSNTVEFVSNYSQQNKENVSEVEKARELNPYIPSRESFQSDAQIRDAFSNYLKYHLVRKNGKQKILADTTVYDYCSRVKVLWEIIYKEYQSGMLKGKVNLSEENILQGKTFLNAYNNESVLAEYIYLKNIELTEIELGEREPFSFDELRSNPLNNRKNLGNTIAAFTKFTEFKEKTQR